MAGYSWKEGMSNNAVAAYAIGKMPLSKWTKQKIIARVSEYMAAYDDENIHVSLEALKKKKKSELLKLLTADEWHHTSSHFNKTYFYDVDIDRLKELDSDASDLTSVEDRTKPIPVPVVITVANWGGSKRHPVRLDNSKHCGIKFKNYVYTKQQKFLTTARRMLDIKEFSSIDALITANAQYQDEQSFLEDEYNKRKKPTA